LSSESPPGNAVVAGSGRGGQMAVMTADGFHIGRVARELNGKPGKAAGRRAAGVRRSAGGGGNRRGGGQDRRRSADGKTRAAAPAKIPPKGRPGRLAGAPV
jgi:hypothetical protein